MWRTLIVVVALNGCAKAPEERRHLAWQIEQDIESDAASPVGERRQAWEFQGVLHAPEYYEFLDEIATLPVGRRSLIYYEASPANGHYFFAAATDGAEGCHLVAGDHRGFLRRRCAGFASAQGADDFTNAEIRDRTIVALLMFEPGAAPTRHLAVLGIGEPGGGASADRNLLAEVGRLFTAPPLKTASAQD